MYLKDRAFVFDPKDPKLENHIGVYHGIVQVSIFKLATPLKLRLCLADLMVSPNPINAVLLCDFFRTSRIMDAKVCSENCTL